MLVDFELLCYTPICSYFVLLHGLRPVKSHWLWVVDLSLDLHFVVGESLEKIALVNELQIRHDLLSFLERKVAFRCRSIDIHGSLLCWLKSIFDWVLEGLRYTPKLILINFWSDVHELVGVKALQDVVLVAALLDFLVVQVLGWSPTIHIPHICRRRIVKQKDYKI